MSKDFIYFRKWGREHQTFYRKCRVSLNIGLDLEYITITHELFEKQNFCGFCSSSAKKNNHLHIGSFGWPNAMTSPTQ